MQLEPTGVSPLTREDQAVFAEPWQAQVLALADGLIRSGLLSPTEWAETLGAELKKAAAADAPDTAETYYAAALAALETLTDAKAEITRAEMKDRCAAWERAYLRTPHGQPVRLEIGGDEP